MKKFFIILAKIFLIILEIIIHILGFLGACLLVFNIIRGMKIFPIWLKILIVIVALIILALAIFMIRLIVYCIKINPDLQNRNNKKWYRINYTVKSDLYNLNGLSDEITPIVRKYNKNAKLVHITYFLRSNSDKKVYLYFFQKNYKNPDKSHLILVPINILNKKIKVFTSEESSNYDGIRNLDELTKVLENDLKSMINLDTRKIIDVDNSGVSTTNYNYD